jgi:hypothetical protein
MQANKVTIALVQGAKYDLFSLMHGAGLTPDTTDSISSIKLHTVSDENGVRQFLSGTRPNDTCGREYAIDAIADMAVEPLHFMLVMDYQRATCRVCVGPPSMGVTIELEVIQGNVNSIETN